MPDEKEKNRPVFKATVGRVDGLVWQNKIPRTGKVWYSVTVDRRYVDMDGVERRAKPTAVTT